MKGDSQLKETASSSFIQQMYKQKCLSLPSHFESLKGFRSNSGLTAGEVQQRASMHQGRQTDDCQMPFSLPEVFKKKNKRKEEGCFTSLVGSRNWFQSYKQHLSPPHLQSSLDAESVHSPCSTHGNQESHPCALPIFISSLLHGQAWISPVLHRKGPEANRLAKSRIVLLLQGIGQTHPIALCSLPGSLRAPRWAPP